MRKFGFNVTRYHPLYDPSARKKALLSGCNIDVVLDVGASRGQFALHLRSLGYKNRIVSFEPLSSEFERLKKNARNDSAWKVYHCALGDICCRGEINVAANKESSSLLKMLPSHVSAAPDSSYIGKEEIEQETLDSVFADICSENDRVFLKIDTQGYEKKVLEGAAESLPSIDTVQLEMSFIPLYEGEALFCELFEYLHGRGHRLIALEEVLADQKSWQLQQVDGLFHRALQWRE